MTSKRLKNAQELKALRAQALTDLAPRLGGGKPAPDAARQVLVCFGGGCLASGAHKISAAFTAELAAHGLAHRRTARLVAGQLQGHLPPAFAEGLADHVHRDPEQPGPRVRPGLPAPPP